MKVDKFEILDHGIQQSDYFQGCGIAYTEYTDVATGIGSNLWEALNDAAEQLAQMGWDLPEEIEREIEKAKLIPEQEGTHTDCGDKECYATDTYYFASIRVK